MPVTLGPQAGGGALAATAAAAEETIPVCSLSQFTVQCGHGPRGYVLDVINAAPTIDGNKTASNHRARPGRHRQGPVRRRVRQRRTTLPGH